MTCTETAGASFCFSSEVTACSPEPGEKSRPLHATSSHFLWITSLAWPNRLWVPIVTFPFLSYNSYICSLPFRHFLFPFFFFFLIWWRNSGYNFKWSYSVALLLTLDGILFRNKWWHWRYTSTSSTTGYSILKRLFEMQPLLGEANFLNFGLFWEWEKRYYSRYSFQKCQKTNAS